MMSLIPWLGKGQGAESGPCADAQGGAGLVQIMVIVAVSLFIMLALNQLFVRSLQLRALAENSGELNDLRAMVSQNVSCRVSLAAKPCPMPGSDGYSPIPGLDVAGKVVVPVPADDAARVVRLSCRAGENRLYVHVPAALMAGTGSVDTSGTSTKKWVPLFWTHMDCD